MGCVLYACVSGYRIDTFGGPGPTTAALVASTTGRLGVNRVQPAVGLWGYCLWCLGPGPVRSITSVGVGSLAIDRGGVGLARNRDDLTRYACVAQFVPSGLVAHGSLAKTAPDHFRCSACLDVVSSTY